MKEKNIKKDENTNMQNSNFWMRGVNHENKKGTKNGDMEKKGFDKKFPRKCAERRLEKKNK